MSEAEELLRQILEKGDFVRRNRAGRYVIQLVLDDTEIDRLLAFGADAAEREDGADDEPDDCPVVLSFDRVPVRQIYLGRS